MATQIQIRRDLAVNWTSSNPILAEGELGIETDDLTIESIPYKIGDGVNNWDDLPYQSTDLTAYMSKAVYDPQNINADTFDRANQTGTQNASTISNFDSSVSANSDVTANTAKRSYPLADETRLANTNGTNTGDEDTASIQSKRPLKTVGGTSIEGSGDIPIPDTATWGGISGTLSDQTDLQGELDAKENTITAGTTGEYYRGDKTFQSLDSTAVGLGNVDNTSDANKPVSTATQTALDDKVAIATNPSKTVKGAIKAFDDTATDTLWVSIDGTDIP